jgi:Na+/melibiose symporter-like transporter
VIDLDALRSREQRAGLLLAFWGMAQKGADAIGVGAGLFILSLFSFDPNGPVTSEGLLGLKIVYIVLPILFAMLSAAFVWNFPLTPKRQKRIRALLHRRAMRLAARPTSSGHRN